MGDGVVAAEELFEGAAQRVAVAARAGQDVRGQGGLAGGDLPDVQVVDLGHAGSGGELVAVRASGRASVYSLAQPALLQVLSAGETVLAVTGNAVVLCPVWGNGR